MNIVNCNFTTIHCIFNKIAFQADLSIPSPYIDRFPQSQITAIYMVRILYWERTIINPFPAIQNMSSAGLVACIVFNMDPGQTAFLGAV